MQKGCAKLLYLQNGTEVNSTVYAHAHFIRVFNRRIYQEKTPASTRAHSHSVLGSQTVTAVGANIAQVNPIVKAEKGLRPFKLKGQSEKNLGEPSLI